jgi:carbon starvation protein
MSILLLVISAIALLFIGYFFYGFFLSKMLKLNPQTKTPAYQYKDGVDFVPAGKFYLLGQHLSAIAAAGPIVGPILAGMWFGWLPTILWIIFGGIFIGGVHDLTTIVASIRHRGQSIAEVIRENMSRRAFVLFLFFLWFSLIYIIIAFTDITASTFVEPLRGSRVASASMMYLGLAVIMGVTLRRSQLSLWLSTLIFLPFVFLCIFLGNRFPLNLPPLFCLDLRSSWDILLLSYCFFASVIPVWLLLQPRGYLGGFFLTFTAGVSFIGLVVGSISQKFLLQYPAFTGWLNPEGLPLLPLLFTTVACGACSGFHAIVASGTTSKQLNKETDARLVGYGGMLLESFVAIIALSSLLLLKPAQVLSLKDPNQIYANGIAAFLNSLGVNKEYALNFALLAFATFVYDTLDVATRLGRYIFQELTGLRGKYAAHIATLATLFLPFSFVILPAFFVSRQVVDAQGNVLPAWKIFWTIFGSSNQLLASLVLFGVSIWLFRKKINYAFTLIPAFFMMFIAVFSIYLLIRPWLFALFQAKFSFDPIGITGTIMLLLTVLLIIEGARIFFAERRKNS